jgi:hypothetical protein
MNPLMLTSRTGDVTKRDTCATKTNTANQTVTAALYSGGAFGEFRRESPSTRTTVGETEVVSSESNPLNHYYNL